ncbi:MAG: hypothetical protein RBT30_01875 [Patescibacteria group bacterium]|jgi:P pilus assembly chaperone PapD|nr:hypothetical protein [Patescibacteria group bacterium]
MKKKEKIDLSKYENGEHLSLKQMNIGLWLALNRRRLLRVFIIFLIIVAASTFTYSSYSYVMYFLYGRQADRDLAATITANLFDTQAYREATAPQVMDAKILKSFGVSGNFDFLIELKNPNSNYYGTFEYCLENTQGENLTCGSSFVLPDSKKFLILPAQNVNQANNLEFQTINIFWQRLNVRKVPDWSTYLRERLNFEITNIEYQAPDYSARTPLHSLSFNIENKTAYNLKRLPLNIILSNNSVITGVNLYNLDTFLSFENRKVQLSWPAGGERANKVEIIPDVNILDESIYLPYRS